MAKLAHAAATDPKPEPPAKKPTHLLVLDTTATAEQPKRVHEMIVDGTRKSFTFEAGKPLPLDPAVAIKFLKHDAFWLVDDKGQRQEYRRRPKQPDELQAGEKLVLADNETVARYDELSSAALVQRVLELPGSDKFASANPSRAEMIRFVVDTKAKVKALNTSKVPDVRRDEFVSEAEADDDVGFE